MNKILAPKPRKAHPTVGHYYPRPATAQPLAPEVTEFLDIVTRIVLRVADKPAKEVK